MKRSLRALSLIAPVAFLFAAGPALAQPGDIQSLESRLDRLERSVQDLGAAIYRDGAAPSGGVPAAGSGQRLSDIEASLRQLTGAIEQMQYELRALKEQQDRFERDAQYRLLTIENGGTPPAGMAPPPPASSGGGAGMAPMTPPMPSPDSSGMGEATGGPTNLGYDGEGAGGAAPGPSNDMAANLAPGSGVLGTIPAPPPGSSADSLYSQGMDQLSRAQYPQAQQLFQQVVANYGTSEFAPQAQFWIADIYYVQKDYTAAARSYAEVLKRYPDSGRAPDAMLKLGLSLMELGQKNEGCTTLGALRSKYPNASDQIVGRAQREAKKAGCA